MKTGLIIVGAAATFVLVNVLICIYHIVTRLLSLVHF
jgi:hypothetical protein